MAEQTILFLTAEEVRRALPMSDAIAAIAEAFRQLSAGMAHTPDRLHLDTEDPAGTTLVMPVHLPVQGRIGVKVATLCNANREAGLPTLQALVIVLDDATGSPLAIMDGAALTAIRTGAASGAATRLLAREDSARVAIFGAGVQARTQLEAVCAVRDIQLARVFDVEPERAAAFANEMSGRLGVTVEAARSAAAAIADVDIVCTATNASTPVFDDSDLPTGVHINAIGSYQPDVQEIPPETVHRAYVVVDHRASALAETGDLIQPIRAGIIDESHVAAELGEIVDGRAAGRRDADQITLFESVGNAVQDLAAAIRVIENTRKRGLGRELPR
jgi:ornithine cyclodeaminase/alanine dehydrogenase-like protein (mu-crystallin family)